MECPSCGYHNREGAQYCNMCLYSFVKPQPESARPRQLQTQTVARENSALDDSDDVNQPYPPLK